MLNLIEYKKENFERIKKYLDNSKELNLMTESNGTQNQIYLPIGEKGILSLNEREKTIYYSPLLDENIKFSELKKGLLKLTK